MTDPRLKRLADVLVNYSIKVQPGDWVYINSSVTALPLLEEVYRSVLKAGGNVTTNIYTDTLNETFYKEAKEAQLDWISPVAKQVSG